MYTMKEIGKTINKIDKLSATNGDSTSCMYSTEVTNLKTWKSDHKPFLSKEDKINIPDYLNERDSFELQVIMVKKHKKGVEKYGSKRKYRKLV